MDQIYLALTETFIPWVEDRFGRAVAWAVVAALIALPLAAMVAMALWLISG